MLGFRAQGFGFSPCLVSRTYDFIEAASVGVGHRIQESGLRVWRVAFELYSKLLQGAIQGIIWRTAIGVFNGRLGV